MPWPFSRKKSTEPETETTGTETTGAAHASTSGASPHSILPNNTMPKLHQTRTEYPNVPYLLPKDLDETHRLDFQHHLLRSILKGNTLVPLNSPQSILDVGCGTGIWGHEMAEEFPNAQVVGLDLLPVTRPRTPDNYMFVKGNILESIPFPPSYFDFVHMRLLINAVPKNSWPAVMQRLYTVVRPGGYIEMLEAGGDPFRPGGQACATMFESALRVAATRGIDPREMYQLGKYAAMAGFVDIQSRTFEIPIGNWGGRAGTMVATDMSQGMKAFKEPMQAVLGFSAYQFDELCDAVIREWENYHSTYTFIVYTARKHTDSSKSLTRF